MATTLAVGDAAVTLPGTDFWRCAGPGDRLSAPIGKLLGSPATLVLLVERVDPPAKHVKNVRWKVVLPSGNVCFVSGVDLVPLA